jgi:hypothetical protein
VKKITNSPNGWVRPVNKSEFRKWKTAPRRAGAFGLRNRLRADLFLLGLFAFQVAGAPAAFLDFIGLLTHGGLLPLYRIRYPVYLGTMKREVVWFNVFLLQLVFFTGCSILEGNSAPKIRMAFFVEQEPHRGEPVVEMKVLRSKPRTVFVAANTVMELGKGTLDGALLREGDDNVLSFELYFTSQGSLLLQEITTRFRQQRLYVVVAMPDKEDKKKMTSRCIGVVFIENTVNTQMLKFTPDADEAEAIAMVNGINKMVR